MKFSIKGDAGNITVKILQRNYPDGTNYYDANWVSVEINISIPGYTASFIENLLTFEIENFAQHLKQMYSGVSNSYSFSSLEDLLKIECKVNKLGHINWDVETTYPIGIGAKLTFSLASDQSYLPDLIADLDLIIKEFPVLNRK